MLRQISGVNTHPLEGPGYYGGARVVGSNLVGGVTIVARSRHTGTVLTDQSGVPLVNQSFAAGAAVGSALAGGVSLPQAAFLIVTMTNAADKVEVDMSGPKG